MPLRSNTSAIIFVTAMAHRGVVGEGFQTFAFPAAKDSEKFLAVIRCDCICKRQGSRSKHVPPVDRDGEVECCQYTNDAERIWYYM